mgnify:CR=1 FL=1
MKGSLKKWLIIILLLILLILIGFRAHKKYSSTNVEHSNIYEKNIHFKSYFGEKLFSEIEYRSTKSEEKVGEEVVERMKNILGYLGPEEDANPETSALQRYYWFPHYEKPTTCEYDVELITTKLDKNKGHVWVSYNISRFNNKKELIHSASSSLTLLYVEKKNGVWGVTDTHEHP